MNTILIPHQIFFHNLCVLVSKATQLDISMGISIWLDHRIQHLPLSLSESHKIHTCSHSQWFIGCLCLPRQPVWRANNYTESNSNILFHLQHNPILYKHPVSAGISESASGDKLFVEQTKDIFFYSYCEQTHIKANTISTHFRQLTFYLCKQSLWFRDTGNWHVLLVTIFTRQSFNTFIVIYGAKRTQHVRCPVIKSFTVITLNVVQCICFHHSLYWI